MRRTTAWIDLLMSFTPPKSYIDVGASSRLSARGSNHFPVEQSPAARFQPQPFALLFQGSSYLNVVAPAGEPRDPSRWRAVAQLAPSIGLLMRDVDRIPGIGTEPRPAERQPAVKHAERARHPSPTLDGGSCREGRSQHRARKERSASEHHPPDFPR